jgi:hypothetical protein
MASISGEWIKPVLVGLVGGIILAPIVAFSADWVVTTGTMDAELNATGTDLPETLAGRTENWAASYHL